MADSKPKKPKKTVNVVFTFDDGPHSGGNSNNLTIKALNVLKTNSTHPNTKAAFFVQTHVSYRGGSSKGKSIIKQMGAEGHVVGIHTGSKADHEIHPSRVKKGKLKDDLRNAKTFLTGLNITPRYVRPPTGAINSAVIAAYNTAKLKMILWDVDSNDSHKGYTHAKITKELPNSIAGQLAKSNYNLIVLFHELDKDTQGHIGKYIELIDEIITAKGYVMKTPKTKLEIISIFNQKKF